MGNPGATGGDWLILTPKENIPKPEKVYFPKPPKAPDGSLMYERIPNKPEAEKITINTTATTTISNTNSPSLKKRAYEEVNGVDSKCFIH